MSRIRDCLAAFLMVAVAIATAALAAAPYGRIGEKYAALGGPGSALGNAIGNETDAPYGGRFHLFQNGLIYWHPEIGEAFAVWGAISSKWWQLGRVEYGYPITDERVTPDGRGRYNHFRALHLPGKPEASIYWTPQTGANAIYGLIRDAWAKGGWERGELGYPTSDEFQDGPFRRSNFERGYILWSQAKGIQIVKSGAPIVSATPPNTFARHLVTGLEIAVDGRAIAGDATFLSENTLCSSGNMAALSAWLRNEALSRLNPRIKNAVDVTIRNDAQLTLHCSFRAEVVRACQNEIALRTVFPKNLFKFWIDMPGPDPGFSLDFDLEASTTIFLPSNSKGRIGIGATTAKVSNLKPDSQNPTGDVYLAAVKAFAMIYEFFSGEDVAHMVTQDRQFVFKGVTTTLDALHPALSQIPPHYRIDACIGAGNVMRLNGTNAARQQPKLN